MTIGKMRCYFFSVIPRVGVIVCPALSFREKAIRLFVGIS